MYIKGIKIANNYIKAFTVTILKKIKAESSIKLSAFIGYFLNFDLIKIKVLKNYDLGLLNLRSLSPPLKPPPLLSSLGLASLTLIALPRSSHVARPSIAA